jgi:hypothetical protein
MEYDVKFTLWIDSEKRFNEKDIVEIVRKMMNGVGVEASNVELLEVRD